MHKKVMYLVYAFLLSFIIGCSQYAQESVSYSDSLIVLPGAAEVKYLKLNGTDQVYYSMKVNYPAEETISDISKRLEKKGWQPLKENYLNPGLPTSHVRGWTRFIDGTKKPEIEVRAWSSDWKNQSGDVLTHSFSYRYPAGSKQDLTSLKVIVIYIPATVAIQALQEVRGAAKHEKRGGEN